MPIYEYFCPKCQAEFQLMRPIQESGEPGVCPKCGSEGQKLLSVFASKSEYAIKVPAKDAFRGHPEKERAK